MAASDEFPRGVTQTVTAAGGSTATIVFPASPGIAWKLVAVKACLYTFTENMAEQVLVQSGGVTVLGPLLYLLTGASGAEDEWTGEFCTAAGKDLTLTYNVACPSGVTQCLSAEAWPI